MDDGRQHRVGRRRAGAAALLAPLLVTACASGGAAPDQDRSYGAPTAEMAVRGFLDAANVEDYGTMMVLFGTADGPAVERFGVTDVEQRMIFLSRLLRHQSYELRLANLAQLGPERVRYVAAMRGTRKGDVSVPIVAVPDRGGRWYVERLGVEAVTGSALE